MPQDAPETVVIHTDGSCLSNPGPGGWAAILQWQDKERELSGSEPDTTNNRMELMAAIMGLNAVTRPMAVDLHTDSRYVMNGVQDWMPRWKANGWKTAAKKPVANQDLWQQLDVAVARTGYGTLSSPVALCRCTHYSMGPRLAVVSIVGVLA